MNYNLDNELDEDFINDLVPSLKREKKIIKILKSKNFKNPFENILNSYKDRFSPISKEKLFFNI